VQGHQQVTAAGQDGVEEWLALPVQQVQRRAGLLGGPAGVEALEAEFGAAPREHAVGIDLPAGDGHGARLALGYERHARVGAHVLHQHLARGLLVAVYQEVTPPGGLMLQLAADNLKPRSGNSDLLGTPPRQVTERRTHCRGHPAQRQKLAPRKLSSLVHSS
jgi:hypothetical protein